MANTLTNLIPTIVKGLDVVSRELVGMIPGVNRDPSTDRLAKNQTLYSWATPSATISDITPANVSPQAGDKAQSSKSISITNYKMSDFYFTGEEEKALSYSGSYGNIVTDMIEQSIRTVVNQMESDTYSAAYVGASRAYGTAGTAPFVAGLNDLSGSSSVRKILDDNGAPQAMRSLVIDTTAGAALRANYQLTRANEAGTVMTLRDGSLMDMHGFSVRESAQITAPAVGTMASATSTSAAFTVGQTVIPLAAVGTGLVAAGDIITFANDTNKYVINSVSIAGANPAAADTITLAAPGLRKAQGVATRAITVVAAATRNLAFSKNAILLATRLPARPSGGDMASDVQTVTDSRSGISIEVSMYPQYRQVRYEIAAAWGITVIKPEHIATLLG